MPNTVSAFIDRTEGGFYVIYTDDDRSFCVNTSDYPGFCAGEAVSLTCEGDSITDMTHDRKRTAETAEKCRSLFGRLIRKKNRSDK